jgi:hypothetical protein
MIAQVFGKLAAGYFRQRTLAQTSWLTRVPCPGGRGVGAGGGAAAASLEALSAAAVAAGFACGVVRR